MSETAPHPLDVIQSMRVICVHGVSPVLSADEIAEEAGDVMTATDIITGLGTMLMTQDHLHYLGAVINDGTDDMWILRYRPETGAVIVQWDVVVRQATAENISYAGMQQMLSSEWALKVLLETLPFADDEPF
jgi:hypothetical protein